MIQFIIDSNTLKEPLKVFWMGKGCCCIETADTSKLRMCNDYSKVVLCLSSQLKTMEELLEWRKRSDTLKSRNGKIPLTTWIKNWELIEIRGREGLGLEREVIGIL